MGIYIKDSDNDSSAAFIEELESQECFYCGGHLFDDLEHSTGGVVFWHGMTGLIALHQPCAEKIGVNLIQDARSLVSKVKRIAKLRHETPKDANYLWHTK